MVTKLKILSVALLLSSLVTTTGAQTRELTVRNFEFWKSSENPVFGLSIGVMQQSFLYANLMLASDGRSPLYCQPSRLTLTLSASLEIMDKEMSMTTRAHDAPLSLVFLDGLRRTFPCGK